MRTLLFVTLVVASLTSCKSPLPVYFDKPIGTAADSFPKEMQGNYYPIDQILQSGQKNFEKNFYVKDGKIIENDGGRISKVVEEKINSELQREAEVAQGKTDPQPEKQEEDNFYKIAKLNDLTLASLYAPVDSIDHKSKIIFGFVRVTKNKIDLIVLDSLKHQHETTIIQLGNTTKLTSYSDEYYLNFKTSFGWEFMKLESWNKGEFLNVIPFYFTNYDDKTGDAAVFLKSTSAIYPGLKPIYNSEHLIIGLKAVMDPKIVKDKFKLSENNIELLKVKE